MHMVGSLAEILLKKPIYKGQMDQLLAQFVFPEFASPFGHLRARACWVLHYFCNVKFKEETVLAEAINLTQRALLTDSELPVKVISNFDHNHAYLVHLASQFLRV